MSMKITWRDANGNRAPGSYHPEFDGRVQGERDLFRRYGKPADMAVSAGPFIEEGHINEEAESTYSAMAAEALGIRGQEPWWLLTDWIIANWPKIQGQGQAPVVPVTKPPAPTPPPAVQPPLPVLASSNLHPWSPADVRVEELRVQARDIVGFSGLSFYSGIAGFFEKEASWSRAKPLLVSVLRTWRRIGKLAGDPREIPAEDR